MSRGIHWPTAAVWVAADDAGRGSVPPRCARSGERCMTRYRLRATTAHPALEWLAWTRLWPRPRFVGDVGESGAVVPLLPRSYRWHRGLELARDATAAAVPLLGLLAIVASGAWSRVAGRGVLLALLLHLIVAVLGVTTTVELRLDVSRRWVRYARVSAPFADAVARTTRRPPEEPLLRPAETPAPAGVVQPSDE